MFLDACETGLSPQIVIDDPDVTGTARSFPTALLTAGARGVLVSESKVWDDFALFFGNALIEKLLSGKEVATSLLETRHQFLTNSNNPMGLLFSYYGNPDVRILAKQHPEISKTQ